MVDRARVVTGGCGCLHLLSVATLAACSSSRSLGGGVTLEKLSPELRVEAEYRDESFDGGASASTRETIFRENVKFDIAGNAYHPKLLAFGGVLDLGLEQRDLDQRGAPGTIHSDDDNNRYDVHAALLKDHAYSARLFAQRNQVRVRQSFFPTNDAVATRHGAMLTAKEWIVPSQLEVSRYDFVGESGDLRRENRDSLNLAGARNTDDFSVHYTVFAQAVDSDLAGGRYDDFQALGGATWRFGESSSNSLSIDGQRREQTGDTANANSDVGVRTRLELTDELEHRSGVTVGRSQFGDREENATDRADAFAELEHRLYESLRTTVRGDFLQQSIGTGDIDRAGGSVRLAYKKKVPFGLFRSEYRQGHSEQAEAGRLGANVTVANEPHVIVSGQPVILGNENVDEANLLVTDQSGALVYTTPADWLAESTGPLTRLVFPPGSQIVPGQTILVTYTFAVGFDRAFATDTQFALVELLFGESFRLSSHWSHLEQDLISGTSGSTLDQSTEIGVGAQAKFGAHTFTVEHVDHDSLLTPYARSLASWSLWLPFDDRWSLTGSTSVYETDFKDDQPTERGYSALMHLNWQAREGVSVEVQGELRRSELRTEDGWGAFLQGMLRYHFRRTAIDFSLLGSREDWDVSSDKDVVRAMLTVTRRL